MPEEQTNWSFQAETLLWVSPPLLKGVETCLLFGADGAEFPGVPGVECHDLVRVGGQDDPVLTSVGLWLREGDVLAVDGRVGGEQ